MDIHKQPDDSFTRDAEEIGKRIMQPLAEATLVTSDYNRQRIAEATREIVALIDMYATLSRGILAERELRKSAEFKIKLIEDAFNA